MRRILVMAAVSSLMFALAACGGSKGNGIKPGKKGGTLTILSTSDVDHFDPGLTREPFSLEVFGEVDRSLYAYAPPGYDTPVPDLADGQPEVSADQKTVTVKIRSGVRFSPPVNREITAKDVAYGLSRTFTKQVPNSYVGSYFGAIHGIRDFRAGKTRTISGITTPDDHTIVLKLDKSEAGLLTRAMTLPATAPVPEEYASKFDRSDPSTYAEHQVASGPYMFTNDASGRVTGHTPGHELKLIRNPNWDPKTDFRPAYLDAVDIREGTANARAATRKILDGSNIMAGNLVPPAQQLRSVARGPRRGQLAFAPARGVRHISMNLRKDRTALTRAANVVSILDPQTSSWDIAFTWLKS